MRVSNKPRSFFDAISIRVYNNGMPSLCLKNLTKAGNRMRSISKRHNKYVLRGRDSFPLMSKSDMYDNMYCINDPLNLGMPEVEYENYITHPTLGQISTNITKEGYY